MENDDIIFVDDLAENPEKVLDYWVWTKEQLLAFRDWADRTLRELPDSGCI